MTSESTIVALWHLLDSTPADGEVTLPVSTLRWLLDNLSPAVGGPKRVTLGTIHALNMIIAYLPIGEQQVWARKAVTDLFGAVNG